MTLFLGPNTLGGSRARRGGGQTAPLPFTFKTIQDLTENSHGSI